jgi:hypothetical protein
MQYLRTQLLSVAACLSLLGTTSRLPAESDSCACCDSSATCGATCCYRSAGWYVAQTENFRACATDSETTARQLAESAEKLRRQLREKWLGESGEVADEAWHPKCEILLYPSQASYVAAAGRGSEHTVGSSLVNVEHGQIKSRRIDLAGGRSDFLSAALPHELTHVVLKDRFLSTAIPRWADEGAAILADTGAKQGRHRSDLDDAIRRHATFAAANLVTMDDYPGPDRMGAFYGESASLTKFLVERGKPARFIDFVELAAAKGYDAALRQCYGISSVIELDRQWRRYVSSPTVATSSDVSAVLAAR